jgi:HAMP domain-containing protein
MHDANQTLALNMSLMVAFLGAALLSAWLLGKHSIADRIGVLEQASQRLANGDLKTKVADVVNPRGGDHLIGLLHSPLITLQRLLQVSLKFL